MKTMRSPQLVCRVCLGDNGTEWTMMRELDDIPEYLTVEEVAERHLRTLERREGLTVLESDLEGNEVHRLG